MMNCDEMPAGRALDARVAELVFGYKVKWDYVGIPEYEVQHEQHTQYDRVPEYSTSIPAAWEVVEKMRADGFVWSINYRNPMMSDYKYMPHVGFWHYTEGKLDKQGYSDALEVPLSICRAALKAVSE